MAADLGRSAVFAPKLGQLSRVSTGIHSGVLSGHNIDETSVHVRLLHHISDLPRVSSDVKPTYIDLEVLKLQLVAMLLSEDRSLGSPPGDQLVLWLAPEGRSKKQPRICPRFL